MLRSEVQGIRLKAKFPIRLKAKFPKREYARFALCCCFHFCFTMCWFRIHLGCWGLCCCCIVCVLVSDYILVHVLHSQFNLYFHCHCQFLHYVDVRLCFCLQYYAQFILFCSNHDLLQLVSFCVCCVCSHHVHVGALLCLVLIGFVLCQG